MCILRFDWLIGVYLFYLTSSQREFFNRKNSGIREEVSDVKKSLCKNILFVSSRLCTSPLVRAPPQLTLFTSPTTPSTPPHMRGSQFSTLEILQSSDKFTGKRRTQIYVYVYIYMSLLFRSTRLGWRRPPSRTNSSIPKKTRIPVGCEFALVHLTFGSCTSPTDTYHFTYHPFNAPAYAR